MQTTGTVAKKISISTTVDDLKQLTKFGLSVTVVFSSIAGYLLAADEVSVVVLIMLAVGGYFLVGASNAFNQVIEKDTDKLMKRTMNRPLPAERMSKNMALAIATVMTLLGIVILYNINPKTVMFGAISVFLYTSIYTPLKKLTPLSVFAGAIPGAIPFMLGWVAATGSFGIEPGMLFMIQFFWQFPHFWAIGWLQFDEYKKAGFNMLPTGEKNRKATTQILLYTVCMILVSVVPVLPFTGSLSLSWVAAGLIFIAGLVMLYYGWQLHIKQTDKIAKKLMLSGVLYITLIQVIYVIDKFIH
ncbi:MAG: protoheme IX farnesyltransferase [Flavobacteriales bacterium]|nr:MAG: protoheme IX farnesyltransferase [Flavobacteriales bacterium]